MNSFIIVTCFIIASLSGSGCAFFLWAVIICISNGRLRYATEAAFTALLFAVLFIISAHQFTKRIPLAPKCRCAEIYLAGVHDGAGAVFEAFTNTLHDAGIVMIPTGGRDE